MIITTISYNHDTTTTTINNNYGTGSADGR